MSDERSVVFEFVSEAKEHLANVSDDLLALEQGRPGAAYRLDRLFRSVHSIKGGAGFFAFLRIADLAHAMESLLDRLRGRDGAPAPETVEALLAGADLLYTLFDDVERSNDADVSAACGRLLALAGAAPAAPAAQPLAAPNPLRRLAEELRAVLPHHEADQRRHVHLLAGDLAELHRLHRVSPLDLVRALRPLGSVLEARIDAPGADLDAPLPGGPVYWAALFATDLDAAALGRATGLPADVIESLPAGPYRAQAAEAPAGAPEEPAAVPATPRPGQATVRINVGLLDRLMTYAGELVLVRNQALLAAEQAGPGIRQIVQRLNAVTTDMQEAVMLTRMQPVGNLFGKFPRLVRDLSRQLGKEIELTIDGSEVELDKTILEALSDPLTHLVRNCCDHGLETAEARRAAGKASAGLLSLRARHEGSQILIAVSDDGRGIDPDRVRRKAVQAGLRTREEAARLSDRDAVALILLPGFSTADEVTDVSGRGVGMDVVRTNLEQLGGALDIESEPGRGTTFRLRLPLTVAIIPCLIVVSGGERYALPQKDLEELVCVYQEQARGRVELAHEQEVYRLRDRLLPLVRLDELLARPRPFTAATRAAVAQKYRDRQPGAGSLLSFAVVRAGQHRLGLIVDRILNTEEIVVKPMHPAMKPLRCYSGATIMGDGRVALILDVEGVARHAGVVTVAAAPAPGRRDQAAPAAEQERQSVLLCRGGPGEQLAVALPMVRRIVMVRPSQIETVGDRQFVTVDGVPTQAVRLETVLDVSPCPDQDPLFLLLPRHVRRPVGILLSAIIDTAELTGDLRTDACPGPGVLGTAVVRGRMTLVLDLFRVADLAAPPPPAAPPARHRVLLVDDTQFFRELVRGYLEADGCEVETAVNGAEALEKVGQGSFDLVVSDIEMPVMDGWDLARELRRRRNGLPLLALTTRDSDADRERAAACGFDRYEVKVDRENFRSAVAALLPKR